MLTGLAPATGSAAPPPEKSLVEQPGRAATISMPLAPSIRLRCNSRRLYQRQRPRGPRTPCLSRWLERGYQLIRPKARFVRRAQRDHVTVPFTRHENIAIMPIRARLSPTRATA
eukprot:5295141-Prymnesium_polylepis.1